MRNYLAEIWKETSEKDKEENMENTFGVFAMYIYHDSMCMGR